MPSGLHNLQLHALIVSCRFGNGVNKQSFGRELERDDIGDFVSMREGRDKLDGLL